MYGDGRADGGAAGRPRTVARSGVGILHVAERCGMVMVYLTKSQRDSRALFLAVSAAAASGSV